MNKRLMIIEDERLFGKLLINIFAKDNLPATYVNSGNKALQYPLHDLYIVDYQMPGMNGLETLEALHLKFSSTVHALLITGYDNIDVNQYVKAYDIIAILQKPFEIAHIRHLVRDFFKS